MQRFGINPTTYVKLSIVSHFQFGFHSNFHSRLFHNCKVNMSESDRKLFESIGLNSKLVTNFITSKEKVDVLKRCINEVEL